MSGICDSAIPTFVIFTRSPFFIHEYQAKTFLVTTCNKFININNIENLTKRVWFIATA
ncbi:hypothetical protein Rahaq2_4983 (plasmid) [Rahnella aquatilis CIP 78.65 = ATCC 33071]|uniref:Uncharacterized protein n=1 Tax=Rahnella aquatilis (strain ATCC 33071 / DSM 4594 / JCM 1683 / NBRC 105701 / NCIMB 13365 / CIP 78.65) TaxID=745277 RepID=H2J2A0_RAHAC|nr:hypothetical protein Rahaq2_4983 [Rahnella aquatilis CIP 78.65 = ATCC 33071]